MQSQPPQAAQPTPQLSAPTTVLVHSLETAFLGAVVAGVLAGYQAFAAGLSPGYIIGAGASVVFAILVKWAQSSILSNATAKQNALIAVSDLAEHIPAMHNVVDGLAQDMDRVFSHLSMQAHALPPAEVFAKVASLAVLVPALQQTLTAASTATTLAPAPAQAAIPPPGLPAGAGVPKFIQDQVQQLVQQSQAPQAPVQPTQQPNFMLDQQTTQTGVPVAPQAQPFPPGQVPFPLQAVQAQAPFSALPPSTVPMASLSWQQASQQPTQ